MSLYVIGKLSLLVGNACTIHILVNSTDYSLNSNLKNYNRRRGTQVLDRLDFGF